MKCPDCGREIEYVIVRGSYAQIGLLDGDHIIDYHSTELGESEEINCPECDADLNKVAKENLGGV